MALRKLLLIALAVLSLAGPAQASSVLLGMTTDPWHAHHYTVVSNYVPVCTHQSLAGRLTEARKRHLALYVNLLPRAAGGMPSSSCSTAAIASGLQDAYLRQMAQDIRKSHVRVIIRYAPEFLGAWEPWHSDTTNYIASWRRIWTIFHGTARLAWSPGLPWFGMSYTRWHQEIMNYWPGYRYVDYVDSTTVPHQDEAWGYFSRRLPFLLSFHKPLTLGEVGPTIWPQATLWASRHDVIAVVRLG